MQQRLANYSTSLTSIFGKIWSLLTLSTLLISTTATSVHFLQRRTVSARSAFNFSYPSANVTCVNFNNGPVNFVHQNMASDFIDFPAPLQNITSTTPKVVIFGSSNTDFYLRDIDMTSLRQPITAEKRAIGADYEIAAQMDMRFAGSNARTGSFEDILGLVAGGRGQTFLGSIIGKAHAMEYLLSGKTYDGATGERLGLFNKYYDDSAQLQHAVLQLANRVALFPRVALNQTKAVLSFLPPPTANNQVDFEAFYRIEQLPEEQANVQRFLDLSEGQSRGDFELGLGESVMQLYKQ
jgi:hypothetical protein